MRNGLHVILVIMIRLKKGALKNKMIFKNTVYGKKKDVKLVKLNLNGGNVQNTATRNTKSLLLYDFYAMFFLKSMLTTKMRSTIIVKTQNYLCLFLE